MKRLLGLALALAVALPATAAARALGVEVWTNRGNDAVFQPGEGMQIKVRTSDDAYLLVYEIDAEGAVRVLWPWHGASGFAEGRRTYRLPPEGSGVQLVVEGPVGQGYVVAIASERPFRALPWYLRPYDPRAEEVGYFHGEEDEEDGITAEGRIVGDPFVAMERIRRRVLDAPEDDRSFATAYASYYVGHAVRYPRYLCNDCHRPSRWAWWDGFDPYYTHCSVFDFRVNWSWYWGPSVWFGRVPYYIYVYRPDCPPYYHDHYRRGAWHSSWDGWPYWSSMWTPRVLTRYKSPPPPGYVPPAKWDKTPGRRPAERIPPGFLVAGERRSRDGGYVPVGRSRQAIDESYGRPGGGRLKPEAGRLPGERPRDEVAPGAERRERAPDRGDRPPQWTPSRDAKPGPAERPRGESAPRPGYDRREPPRPEPRRESPRYEPPREERRDSPRYEPPRQERRDPPPAPRAEPAPQREAPKAPPARPDPPSRGGREKR
uniref:DUF4384 domain-containing protein n=1 Tax=Eiseniibacteriota bacterium TaxID=2212470 RepID=A0A832I228_UNCEI